jgi:hypothetical protein
MSRLSSQWDCLSEEVDKKEAAERPPLPFIRSRAKTNFAPFLAAPRPSLRRPLIEPTVFLLLSLQRFFAAPGYKMQLAAGFPASNTCLHVIEL